MLSTLLLTSSLALGVLGASADSAATTVAIYLGPGANPSIAWEASVLGVSGGSTTYELACNQGKECKGGVTATITEGSGHYEFSTMTSRSSTTLIVEEICDLSGTTQAACTLEKTEQAGTRTTSTSTATVFSGAEVQFGQVPVTGGASLLSPTSGSAGNSASAAASSSGGAGGSGGHHKHSKHGKHSGHGGSTASTSGSPSGSSGPLPGTSASAMASPSQSSGSGSGSGGNGGSGGSGSGSSSSSTSSPNAAAPTAISNVIKVLVVPAAALLALT